MNYDFSTLNDKEFEQLAKDLLSKLFNERIERFKPGKDSGVDGRFFSNSGNEIIIQCKHYLKSGYKVLINNLETTEVKKVRKLKPEKYIFVTSLPLSRKNKNEIKNIFAPYIKSENDIFGQEDLNDILSQNPDIERKHYKLWISSTNTLSKFLNEAIVGRSEFVLSQIKKRSKKYVQTENHTNALKILSQKNVIIITGEPGIGKTTLAENLCLYYIAEGFEFYNIEESISEAENVYKRNKKQIFYFDDFLGSNYFEAIGNKKDSHIMKFIERIQKDKYKKFILTSRTNILNLGINYSSTFSIGKIQKNEFTLTIDKLNPFEKEQILYKHIWHSKLQEEYIEEIHKNKRYKDIIKHKNFNPRLIEFITDIDRIPSSPKKYWNYILRTLENPADIWDNCFKTQSNAYIRNLVILTVFNGNHISEEELRKSYNDLIEIENLKNNSHTEKDFDSMIKLSCKFFLNRNHAKHQKVFYTLFNPSIADYILNTYSHDFKKITCVFKALYTNKSLEQLISLEKNKIISTGDFKNIIEELFNDAIRRNKNYDYKIIVANLLKNNDKKYNNDVMLLIKEIIENPSPIEKISLFLDLFLIFKSKLNTKNYNFLLKLLPNRVLTQEEINKLAIFIENNNIKSPQILNRLQEEVEKHLSDQLTNITEDIDLTSYIFENYDNNFDFDEIAIFEDLIDSLKKTLTNMHPLISKKLHIDLDKIAERVDINTLIDEFWESKYMELLEEDYYEEKL